MKTLTRGHIRAGLDSVRGSKMRSFWTMLGVIIGVTSVITVISIGQGIKNQIGGQIHQIGKNIITVRPTALRTSSTITNRSIDVLSGVNINVPLTTHDINAIHDTKGVAASAPLTIVPGNVTQEDNKNYDSGFVVGTTQDLPSLVNQSMEYGSFWDSTDNSSNVAVLGQHAAETMFNENVPLGHSFTFHGQQFIVQGIFNQFTTAPLTQQVDFNNAIFIPNDVAESLTNSTAPTYAILARADHPSQTTQVANAIKGTLAASHGSSTGFQVLSGNQNVSSSDSILGLLTDLVAGIAAISLIVGGLGIMNVMLVSVSERLHEIGIRKAVGATNRQIMSQFMVESAFLSVSGGIIGIILALLINVGLRAATSLSPALSWQLIVIATLVSLLEGIVFGTIPAFKAARKDPILALRSE